MDGLVRRVRRTAGLVARQERGAAAVEFAMVAPLFLALVLGSVSYGYLFWVNHGIQQLASEAARSAVAGLSDSERDRIARDFVTANAPAYGALDPNKITVATVISAGPANTFQVSIGYDLTGYFLYQFDRILPLPDPKILRTAAIQRGGY